MAGFKTHISVSTTLGIAYAATGWQLLDVPPSEAILAGTLCSLGGMLPDLDSKSGVPVRETFAFLSAIVPMMVIEALRDAGMTPHSLILIGILTYILMRFCVSNLFKRYTVHRGMWHSLPAAASVGLLVYLLSHADGTRLAVYNAGGVVLGFLSHLVLDEIWSIEIRRGRLHIKKSFGTALKVFAPGNLWGNISAYAKLIALIIIAVKQPNWLAKLHYHHPADTHAEEQIASERAAGTPLRVGDDHRDGSASHLRR